MEHRAFASPAGLRAPMKKAPLLRFQSLLPSHGSHPSKEKKNCPISLAPPPHRTYRRTVHPSRHTVYKYAIPSGFSPSPASLLALLSSTIVAVVAMAPFATSASSRTLLLSALLCIILCSEVCVLQCGAAIGINYGQVGNNLPTPAQVVSLLSSLRVGKVRIYDVNPQVLAAFAGTGIELIVTVPNDPVQPMAASAGQAMQWVTANIRPYFPATRVTGIAVGNEVFTDDDEALKASLVPAMRNLHAALAQLGMDGYVHVSTASSLGVLANSYPPSQGAFTPECAALMLPFLRFLAETSAPFWINAYPYFAYKADPANVSLSYALSDPYHVGAVDPYTHLQYTSMLYAQVDAVTFAAARLGYGGIPVYVSETGWPSKGDADEVGATADNARAYNRNLLVRQVGNEGTPLRPRQRLEVYLFALFNENMKPGPTSERNYGLYQPDGRMVYNVGLAQQQTTSAASLSLAASSAPPATRDVRKDFTSVCLFSALAILLTSQAFFLG